MAGLFVTRNASAQSTIKRSQVASATALDRAFEVPHPRRIMRRDCGDGCNHVSCLRLPAVPIHTKVWKQPSNHFCQVHLFPFDVAKIVNA